MDGFTLVCIIFFIGFVIYAIPKFLDKKVPPKKESADIKADLSKIKATITNVLQKIEEAEWDEKSYAEPKQYSNQPPPTRKNAKPEIDKFLNVKRKTRIIVFDLETNGLDKRYSVLSCSAIKYEVDPKTYELKELDRFNRYYFPVERFNPQAIAINGLKREVIIEKRGGDSYPKHFSEDPDFKNFCKDVLRFIAHNISFDMKFINPSGNEKKFCTMMTNTNIVATEFLKWKNEWKWPTLSETASYYGIPFIESDLHSSMTDTEIAASIFEKMLVAAKTS